MQPAQPAPESLPPRKPGAALGGLDQGVEGPRAVLEVVAAGGVRGRHQAGRTPRRRRPSGTRPPARTRSFSVRTCRARLRPTGSRRSHSASSCSSDSRREQELAVGRGTRPGTRPTTRSHSARLLVVHPVGQPARGLRVAHHDRRGGLAQRQPVVNSACRSRGTERRSARPNRLENWSSRPEPTPTNSFSDRRSDLGQLHAEQVAVVSVRSRRSSGPARRRAGSGTRRRDA